nr:SDR family oxidoreductase [Pseudoruegeria sp. HB172150]
MILGGYGVFGGRLAYLIRDMPVTALIAGRSEAKARAFCKQVGGTATFQPLALDRDAIADALASHQPDIVIDASGPFQQYTGDRYAVIRACIAARVNYLDFADAADFVFGVPQFDAQARAVNVFVLSGVSSFPVLTAAVLREIAQRMEIEDVTGGIAPSPYAGIGLNVMRAVIGYAGAPVQLLRDGAETTAPGLAETRYYTVAPPGRLPLRHLRFSLVDVPDLRVIPPEYPTMRSIWMGAGPVPDILHRALNLLARLRARGWLPSLIPAAPSFYRVLNLMKFGEHRGGMFVEAKGHADGHPVTISWHLLAEDDDGPMIPSMAIEALLRKAVAGTLPAPGARAATQALDLADYESLFATRTITTGFRDSRDETAAVYPALLGSAYKDLPPKIQSLHKGKTIRTWQGEAEVTPGDNALARGTARLFGFPTRPGTVPVNVTFTPDGKGELWRRDFDGQILKSHQSPGTGRNHRLLLERFGPFAVALALVFDDGKLRLVPRRWTFLGLPLPRAILPGGDSHETEQDGRFRFHVDIRAPLLGRIVRYRGWLQPGAG